MLIRLSFLLELGRDLQGGATHHRGFDLVRGLLVLLVHLLHLLILGLLGALLNLRLLFLVVGVVLCECGNLALLGRINARHHLQHVLSGHKVVDCFTH